MQDVSSLPPDAPPYESCVTRDDLDGLIGVAADNALGGFGSDKNTIAVITKMRSAATDSASVEVLHHAWPLVTRFVRAELDTETAGERGIGRASTAPPRFGGAFRNQLRAPEAREVFGRLSEGLVVAGWTAQTANQQNFAEGPFALRERDAEALWLKWVPSIYAADRGASQSTQAVLDRAFEPAVYEVVGAATAHGLLKGFRSKRKEATLIEISAFHFRAGISLRAHCTSQTDDQY